MVHEDAMTGLPVTLVVSPAQTVSPPPKHPLPFTGFGLLPALLLGVFLLVVGSLLLAAVRRPVAVRIRRDPDVPFADPSLIQENRT